MLSKSFTQLGHFSRFRRAGAGQVGSKQRIDADLGTQSILLAGPEAVLGKFAMLSLSLGQLKNN
jgi:hypothetical protein